MAVVGFAITVELCYNTGSAYQYHQPTAPTSHSKDSLKLERIAHRTRAPGVSGMGCALVIGF